MMHKAWCSIEKVPYCFPRPSIKFQGHKGQKIDYLDQIWARLLGRSQLSNPSDLPCFVLKGTLKFAMIDLDQVQGKMTHIRKFDKITLQPEIWWHDVVYHEEDHYFKWLCSANVGIFWSRPAEGAVIFWTSCILYWDCVAKIKSPGAYVTNAKRLLTKSF